MMAIVKINRVLSVSRRIFIPENRFGSFSKTVKPPKRCLIRSKAATGVAVLAGVLGSCGVAVLYYLDESVNALAEISLPSFPWAFKHPLKAFDHASLRRGWLVYRTVCHTCHSLRYVRFMDLVDVSHTRDEAKAIAAEYEVQDGPDEQGNYYTRAGKLTDTIPSPYPNEEAARAANSGAYPPDLTYIVYARKGGIDYLFCLLTGFMEPPAGLQAEPGQYFNIYFPGGFTSMPQLLYQGILEYEDGTPATQSQMAKDVVEFLLWAASPEHDTRKLMTIKGCGLFLILLASVSHLYRRYWSLMKTRRIAYVPLNKFADSHPPPCPPSHHSRLQTAERVTRQKK